MGLGCVGCYGVLGVISWFGVGLRRFVVVDSVLIWLCLIALDGLYVCALVAW